MIVPVKSLVARFILSAIGAFALAHTSSVAAAADSPYVLHPGDQLAITVFQEPDLSKDVTVLPDGTIAYPLVGRIGVAGDTIAIATKKLTQAFREYVRDPQVTVALTQSANEDVLVLGDVKTPGKYQLPPSSRVADAIAAAGGLGDINGEYPVARVSIDNGDPTSVNLQQLLRQGSVDQNILLGSKAIVYVPGPTPMEVQVVGNVDKPGMVAVHVGDRLSMAIALAGTSANALADLSHIRLTRVNANGVTSVSEYNLYDALKHGNIGSDPVLAKNDVVYVPEAHQATRMSAVMQGALILLSRIVFF